MDTSRSPITRPMLNGRVSRTPPTGLAVERYYGVDCWNDPIEWLHVNNGRIGLLLDVGYGSQWPQSANMWSAKRQDGSWELGFGVCADYMYPTADGSIGAQCDGPYEDDTDLGGFKSSFVTELEFRNSADEVIDPDSIDRDDESLTIHVSRWIGTGASSTVVDKTLDLAKDQTPAIYLADSAGTAIYQNDSNNTANYTAAGAGFEFGTTKNIKSMLCKVVEYDGPKDGTASGNQKYVRVYFYVPTGGIGADGAVDLNFLVFPGCRYHAYTGEPAAQRYGRYRLAGSTTKTAATIAEGWNYVEIASGYFAPGTNAILIWGRNTTDDDKTVEIALDTSVTTTPRNRAYTLSKASANYVAIARIKYTLYRDSDKIDMEQEVVASGAACLLGWFAGAACQLTYNFGGVMANTYRELPPEYWPLGIVGNPNVIRKSGYKWRTPDRVRLADLATGAAITVTPGVVAANEADTGWKLGDDSDDTVQYDGSWWGQATEGHATYGVHDLVHMRCDDFDLYDSAGIRFYKSSDPSMAVTIICDQNSSAYSLLCNLEKIPDRPHWYHYDESQTTAPAETAALYNDIVFHLRTAQDGVVQAITPGAALPKMTLDLSEIVEYF